MQRYYNMVHKPFLIIIHQKVILSKIIQTKSIQTKSLFQQIYTNINHFILNPFLTKINFIKKKFSKIKFDNSKPNTSFYVKNWCTVMRFLNKREKKVLVAKTKELLQEVSNLRQHILTLTPAYRYLYYIK